MPHGGTDLKPYVKSHPIPYDSNRTTSSTEFEVERVDRRWWEKVDESIAAGNQIYR